ncbi:MAG: hypothetical protein EOP45_21570 [Sphingobacteriaceae bacterium]|nr:MAG: hypothetical protein EOP45_21570 [Sphingobacteriaceae bacterium]
MKELLLPAITLLPGIITIILLAYFYAQKKIPALLLMLIAYIIITLATAVSIYGVRYFQERAMTMEEIQRIYQTVGIVSIIAHLLFTIGLAFVLSKYPDKKDKQAIDFL